MRKQRATRHPGPVACGGIANRFSEAFVARQAAREKQRQQDFRPFIGVHKWFARRPGTLFRALALAELANLDPARHLHRDHTLDGVCLDPFMGGGTPLVEASRLGLGVVGYDTNAMASWVVLRELEALDPEAFVAAAARVGAGAAQSLKGLHDTSCETCSRNVPARYFLWARAHHCTCGERHPLLADTLIASTKLGRHPNEVHLCAGCLHVHECPDGRRPDKCCRCQQPYAQTLTPPGTARVCACEEPYRIPPQGELHRPDQLLACVVYNCPDCMIPTAKRFKQPDAADHGRVDRASRRAARGHAAWPDELIPACTETRRLHRWGYLSWRDLHLPRQLVALAALADAAGAEPDAALRAALFTCVSDLLRFQNALCRYDRSAHKVTDVFAVHGFPVPRVICEAHPLGTTGVSSGGFAHVAAKYHRAKAWCQAPYETTVDIAGRLQRHQPGAPLGATMTDTDRPGPGEATVRCGSIADWPIAPGSADIVLTDPAYFANVQYAQLADLHHVWLRRLEPTHSQAVTTVTDRDAVGSEDVDLAEFAARLSEVYVAAAGALKDNGAFCFTYHHNDLDAYAPVVMACLDGGLAVSAGYACPTEVRASTHIRGRAAATVDAVFVLRKTTDVLAGPETFGPGWVRARRRALRAAGVKFSEADHACIAHSARALAAMTILQAGWDPGVSRDERLERARAALGLPLAVPGAGCNIPRPTKARVRSAPSSQS